MTRVPVPGPRPALGVLTLDDGSAYPLTGFVLGRGPERDQLVRSGRAVPLTLADPTVSRIHARMLANGWDLVLTDAGSLNGTRICPAGGDGWSAVPAGAEVRRRPAAA